jgi:hypothetical protein
MDGGVLLTACSYASVPDIVRPLASVPDEADAIEAAYTNVKRLNDCSIGKLGEALAMGYHTWFFLGHAGARAHRAICGASSSRTCACAQGKSSTEGAFSR